MLIQINRNLTEYSFHFIYLTDTESENPHEKYFKLYDLSKLLSELKRKDPAVQGHVDILTEVTLDGILRQDMYLQSPKIACQVSVQPREVSLCQFLYHYYFRTRFERGFDWFYYAVAILGCKWVVIIMSQVTHR